MTQKPSKMSKKASFQRLINAAHNFLEMKHSAGNVPCEASEITELIEALDEAVENRPVGVFKPGRKDA